MTRRPESAAKAKSQCKLRALWLTTVSGMVLLTGCSTYSGIKGTFFAERPEQKVEGGRRAPIYNAQGLAALPRSAQAAPAQVPQARAEMPAAKPVAGMNPYDTFDQNGEEVEPSAAPQPRVESVIAPNTQSAMTASAMQPATPAPASRPAPASAPATHTPTLVKADDAHFVSGNNMNPPATGANEKDGGTFFSRLFSSNTAPKADPAKRKPIPGNPQYDSHTNLAAPVPAGPLADGNDVTPSKSAESQEVKFSNSPSEPMQPLAEMKQPEPAAKWQEPSAPAMLQPQKDESPALASAKNSNAPIDTMPPAYPKTAAGAPQGVIPLVDAMPMDSEESAPVPAAPLASPRSQWTPPQDSVAPSSFISSAQASETQVPTESKVQSKVESQVESPAEPAAQPPLMAASSAPDLTESDSLAGESKPVLMAAAEPVSEKTSAPSAAEHATKANTDNDGDMFKPQTNFQPKEDEGAVTVSSLADKKPKEKNFFERIFGADDKAQAKPADKATDSKAAPEADGRTWLERQMGFKDTMPQAEKNQAYPNFNTVPANPERLNEIKQSGDQPQREMETMRDQAQESKMELGSEPSGQDMKVAPKEADATASSQQPVHEISKEAVGEPIKTSDDAPPQLLGHVSAPDTVKTEDRSNASKAAGKPVEVMQENAPVVSSEKAPPAAAQAVQTQAVDSSAAPPLPPMPEKPVSSVMMPPAASGNAPALIAPMNMDGTPEPVEQPAAPLAAAPAMEAKPELASEPKVEPAAPQVAAPESIPESAPAAMAEPAPAPVAPLTPPVFSNDNAVDKAPAAAASDNNAQAAGAPASTPADKTTLESGDNSQQAAPPASATNTGLPSPQLLDKVRVLPSSRYESRRQQHSSEE